MTDTRRPSILIVEDNIIMADVLRRAVTRSGFQVQIANNGVEALKACLAADFDAIVTDFQMPELNGLQMVEALRKRDRNSSTPIIFVSGKGLELDCERICDEFGIEKVLFKPFSPRDLIGCLQKCLRVEEATLQKTGPQ